MRFLLFDCTVPAVPQTRLNSACGTRDKIEICLRYRNRTLPWTLPPVPQVSLQLYGTRLNAWHNYLTHGPWAVSSIVIQEAEVPRYKVLASTDW